MKKNEKKYRQVHSIFKKQQGVTAIEYAILAAALAATLFAVAGNDGPLKKAIESAFERVETTISEGGE